MSLIDRDDDEQRRADWREVSDGYVGDCPNCKRYRLIRYANGHESCEKCHWDVTTGTYAVGKPQADI